MDKLTKTECLRYAVEELQMSGRFYNDPNLDQDAMLGHTLNSRLAAITYAIMALSLDD